MFYPYFALAAASPTRQRSLRWAIAFHVCLLGMTAAWATTHPRFAGQLIGDELLVVGIAEGAILMGWRLTQLPKSQALEFLLVSPQRPHGVYLAEALVGLARLGCVALAGLPILVLLYFVGYLHPLDIPMYLTIALTWGAVTGFGLSLWAYEARSIRRWAERGMMVLIVIYLIVGVLAGEHLGIWLKLLPGGCGDWIIFSLEAFHRYNPFAIVQFWATQDMVATWERALAVEIAGLTIAGLFLLRSSMRLQAHFHDLHYQPAIQDGHDRRLSPGDRPLTWWALRRVTQYSGRVNLWLAGGFGVIYAIYTMAGPRWPNWLGTQIFVIIDEVGGIPVWTTALVLLAAVPAAFQYGLWDSNAQDRCRRLELLLLTGLGAKDYWHAAAAAAWRRGRGYFAVAGLLWIAAVVAGRMSAMQAVGALAASVLLWSLYFALGFWAFSRGVQANRLGLALTVALPAIAFGLCKWDFIDCMSLLPPGGIYLASRYVPDLTWAGGALLSAVLMLAISRRALAHCEEHLRDWYDSHHGAIVLD